MKPRQRAFLSAYRETCNVVRACEVSRVGRSSHYRWLAEDPDYREAFDLAKEQASDKLESEAIRRAFEGVETPVGWYKGVPGAFVRRYSDTLLIFLLKGAMPEKYSEKMEVRGLLKNINLELLPDEPLARIAAGEDPYAVLAGMAQEAVSRGLLSTPSSAETEDDNRR